MVRLYLSDQELIDAIRTSVRQLDGKLLVELPDGGTSDCRPMMVLHEDTRTVILGQQNTRLSPQQFALLAYIYRHGRSPITEVLDSVWGSKQASDTALRVRCSETSAALLAANIPYVLSCRRDHVFLEQMSR